MRIVIQRVTRASVAVVDSSGAHQKIAAIGPGFMLLIGVGVRDVVCADGTPVAPDQIEKSLDKISARLAGLRVFSDAAGKMNFDIIQAGGSILAISQFTLYADTSRGRRPGFQDAAPPAVAKEIYLRLVDKLRALGIDVQTGQFGADMAVELCNDGPVTIILDESPQV